MAVFQTQPDVRQSWTRASDGFSQNCRTVDTTPSWPSTGEPGSIQPYSPSGEVGCAPSRTTRPGWCRSTARATSPTWAMKVASPRMK